MNTFDDETAQTNCGTPGCEGWTEQTESETTDPTPRH